jgi:hypothetical protein
VQVQVQVQMQVQRCREVQRLSTAVVEMQRYSGADVHVQLFCRLCRGAEVQR